MCTLFQHEAPSKVEQPPKFSHAAQRRLSFEQLLRKLLAVPGRPAVLLLHWWSPYINRHAFYFSSEDGINTVAAYYGAPRTLPCAV